MRREFFQIVAEGLAKFSESSAPKSGAAQKDERYQAFMRYMGELSIAQLRMLDDVFTAPPPKCPYLPPPPVIKLVPDPYPHMPSYMTMPSMTLTIDEFEARYPGMKALYPDADPI